jgi:outer membrane protein, heavy metal efflux system
MQTRSLLAGALLAGVAPIVAATAQSSVSLDSLIALAIATNPTIRAASSRVSAAAAKVRPASTLPDPMLMLGLINQPLGSMVATSVSGGAMASAGGPDPMTMRMIGVSQTLPYPGKLALAKRSVEHEVDASRAALDAARRQTQRDVKGAYYEIAYVDQALAIVDRNRDVLASLIQVSEARYGVGTSTQQDVLRARVEATRLGETASALHEQRSAAVARLNALLDQPTETPLATLAMPDAITRAAVPASADAIRFSAVTLGARAADSPLRPLAELQAAAIVKSPALREQDAMIAAESTRGELARKASLPDMDLALQYGQRGGGLPDMVSATISLPIPIFKRGKQDQQVVESAAQLAALVAERRATENAIHADVARLVSEIEGERTRLALSVKAILPQSRAALASAAASYQVGRVELLTVLDDQATVFTYEMDYFRALSDFATRVAELERVVGEEVLK